MKRLKSLFCDQIFRITKYQNQEKVEEEMLSINQFWDILTNSWKMCSSSNWRIYHV